MLQESTEQQVAKKLGIAYSSWCLYKEKHPEFSEILKKAHNDLAEDLKSVLIKKAKGFEYTENKKVVKNENGKKTTVLEEYTRFAQPDTGAIHLLLKNIDPEWHNDDKATLDLKKEQLELAKKKQEADEW
jgi:hypothetical protein